MYRVPKGTPWNLSRKEVEAFHAFYTHGSIKSAAEIEGLSYCAITNATDRVRKNMKVPADNRHLHFILWDRWLQTEAGAKELADFLLR